MCDPDTLEDSNIVGEGSIYGHRGCVGESGQLLGGLCSHDRDA